MFLHRYNYDDTLIRAIAIGLLNLLNNQIVIWNRLSDTEIEEVPIPFYYDSAGDEVFMQDIFMNDTMDSCVALKMVEGNIDKIPRGWIRIDSIGVNVATFTNRFVRGEYTRENTMGDLETFNAPVIVVPLDISVTAQIKFDSTLDIFKGWQKLVETFYKVNTFKVLWNGMIIPISAAFPEDNPVNKTYEFSFGDAEQPTLDFNLALETYFPIVDRTLEYKANNTMQSFTVTTFANGDMPIKNYETVTKQYDKVVSDDMFTYDNPDLVTGQSSIKTPSDSNVLRQLTGAFTDNSKSVLPVLGVADEQKVELSSTESTPAEKNKTYSAQLGNNVNTFQGTQKLPQATKDVSKGGGLFGDNNA